VQIYLDLIIVSMGHWLADVHLAPACRRQGFCSRIHFVRQLTDSERSLPIYRDKCP